MPPNDMPGMMPMMGDPMLQQFATMQNDNDIGEIMKELFDKGKIFMITDVSKDEAKLMTRIHVIAKMKGLKRWEEGLQFYAQILLSKKRQSRLESLKAIGGWLSGKRFFDRFRRGGGGYDRF